LEAVVSVYSVTLAELEAMQAVETVEGQGCLVLARNLDESRNKLAVQGDMARLLSVMEELRRRRPVKKTDLDLIRERRARSAG
jgi:hypothetical protein